MHARLTAKTCGTFAIAAATSWWLFADTVRHHLPTDDAPNIVRFCHWGGYRDYAMWRELIDAFARERPDLEIRQEYIAGMGFGYSTKVRQQLVAGTAPDVILFQDEPFVNFAEHAFADLSDLIDPREARSLFHPTAVASFHVDGSLRGLPVFGGTLLIFCNERCFRRASAYRGRGIVPPDDTWTLDEFRRLAVDLTCDFDGDGRTDQYALVLPGWIYQLPMIWATGARVLDDSHTRWMFTDSAALEALTFYQDLRFRDRVVPSAGDLGQMNRDIAFFTDRVAMYITGPWFQPMLAESTLGNDCTIVPPPRGPAGRFTRITWDALCLNRHCPPGRRPAAWAFMRFACAGPGQRIIARQQRAIPALLSAAETFRAHAQADGAKFLDSLDYARTQPITRAWHDMDRTIKRHLADLMTEQRDRITPAQCLSAMASDPMIRKAFGETANR